MGSNDRERDAADATGQEPTHDVEALRATREEARTVLDHQLQTANDVDAKAAMTSRLAVLLLGLVFTAGSFLARADSFDAAPYFNGFTAVGTVLLIASFALAIATYTSTNVETGVGPDDVLRLVDVGYSEEQWLLLLLRSEAKWIRANERRQSLDGTLLTGSHLALLGGLSCLTAGVAVVSW